MLILLDLDGTLTDPFVGIARSLNYAIDRLGMTPLTTAQLRGFIGPPLHDSFAALGLTGSQTDEAVRLYRERYTDTGIFENHVYDGIESALIRLASDGARLAVATSKPTQFAERVLEHFGLDQYFEFVAGATMDGSRSHKTDVVRFALARAGCDGPAAVMVGDRAADVIAAHAVGAGSVGVSWGFAEPGELEAAGAQTIVTSPGNLPPVIRTALAALNGEWEHRFFAEGDIDALEAP
ncbi:MAG: phosphoglycolate phosphatase [Frankiales bacterium]|nr:phosphoglycolate phosphatase [Frankiales bacterium]